MTTEQTTAHTDRIEELLVVMAKALLAPIVDTELADEKMRSLYEMTGEVTADEATKKLAVGKKTVIAAWKRWEQLGLLVKTGKRYRRVF